MKIPIKNYIKDAYIYLSGKLPPKEFYIIKSGSVKITKSNPILGGIIEEIRSVGYIFGIIQCITNIQEDESAQALTDCEIFVINKDKIEDLFLNHKKIILKILSEYSEILRKLDSDLINYNFFPDSNNRKDKIFDIVKKYIDVDQKEKAAHLLKSILNEYPDDNIVRERALGILSKLPDVNIYKSDGIINEISVPAGTVLFTEFELSDDFYVIKKGKVNITKLRHDKEILLAILGDGDIFGEMSILNDKPRNATAFAVEDTDIMVINKKGIDKLPPPIFFRALEFLSKRIWLVQQQLICYKLPLIISRLYFMLVSKVRQVISNPEEEFNNSFIFKFPVEELYQMIDFNYNISNKKEISDFLNDINLEFLKDSIRVKNLKSLFDKNSFYYTRALIIYNNAMDEL